MNKRYKRITDPDGNDIDLFSAPGRYAYLERLDKRNPLNTYYRYRFWVRGPELCIKFQAWMMETFGNGLTHAKAKEQLKLGKSLEDVKWVYQNQPSRFQSEWVYIYFNKECEALIRLKFIKGATLE